MSRTFEMTDNSEWYVLRTTDVFHSFDSVGPEIQWLKDIYGANHHYVHPDVMMFGGNRAYVAITKPLNDALADPEFTFGFKDHREAISFRLTFS